MTTRLIFCLSVVALRVVLPAARADEKTDSEQWKPVPAVVPLGAKGVPGDATVLFDGSSLAAWELARPAEKFWRIEDGAMVVDPASSHLKTKASFGDVQLHLEFRTPSPARGDGQDRGNSGVLFMGLYELQILDSFNNPTYVNGSAGAVYKENPPMVNVSLEPGAWQTFEVVFLAPRFSADGRLRAPARLTVFHNGVLVQYDFPIPGPTSNRGPQPYKAHTAKLPLQLQFHKNAVAFRNIWIRELAPAWLEKTEASAGSGLATPTPASTP